MAGTSKAKKTATTKPVCKYGSKCYRKNLQHVQNYSHPGRTSDEDNSEDDNCEQKPTTARPEKRKKEKTLVEFFRKPSQSHDCSDSDPEDTGAGQPCKKRKEETESATDVQKDNLKVPTEDKNSSDEDTENQEEDDVDNIADSPEDVKENIKSKFLVSMPEDFYQFWEFCQSLKPENPRCALEEALNLILVGPFDILAGRHKSVRKNKYGRRPNFLLHYRYFYDPPEFQTVLASNEKSIFHLGYYRDDPKEEPVFVGSNSPGEPSAEKIYLLGENLFAAVHIYAKRQLKSSSSKKKNSIEQLIKSLEEVAKKHDLPLAELTKNMKDRKKKVVCPTFHGAGIVVPVDSNDVGYRPVPETPSELRALFKRIAEAKSDSEREKHFEDLQELITLVQFANDECDYGEGLELGLDLFSSGFKLFHPQIASLLPLAYQLLNRPEFSQIITAHLKHRREVSKCVDELAVT